MWWKRGKKVALKLLMFVEVKDLLFSRKKQGVHRELQLPLTADLARLFIPSLTKICSIREWAWGGAAGYGL